MKLEIDHLENLARSRGLIAGGRASKKKDRRLHVKANRYQFSRAITKEN